MNPQNERPILFSAPMVRAILAGTKTQTRRVVKMQPRERADIGMHGAGMPFIRNPDPHGRIHCCPYGKPGDRLWVRETHYVEPHPSKYGVTREMIPHTWDQAVAATGTIHYRANPMSEYAIDGRRWTPSIHMPRRASRIDLEITSVRVEQLNAISEADADAEGVEFLRHVPDTDETLTAKQLFECLWSGINGAGSWDANPWVWVVQFKRVDP